MHRFARVRINTQKLKNIFFVAHRQKEMHPQRGAFSFGLSKAGLEPIRCNADERCSRRLDGGDPLFSAKAENANQVLSPIP